MNKKLDLAGLENAKETAAQYGDLESLFWLGVLGKKVKLGELGHKETVQLFEKKFLDPDYVRKGIERHFNLTIEKIRDLGIMDGVAENAMQFQFLIGTIKSRQKANIIRQDIPAILKVFHLFLVQ